MDGGRPKIMISLQDLNKKGAYLKHRPGSGKLALGGAAGKGSEAVQRPMDGRRPKNIVSLISF